MKAELRADGLHISGYVNVPGRESRPVVTKHGKVIEVIEQRAFERAIAKAPQLDLRLDHERTIASTKDSTLTAYEDAVGLRAETVITDQETIDGARAGKLRGWSFNMMNVVDSVEQRTNQLPLRHVKDFDMSEITLALNKMPIYSSTSIELRAGEVTEVEIRTEDSEIEVIDKVPKKEPKKDPPDYSQYEDRISKIKSV